MQKISNVDLPWLGYCFECLAILLRISDLIERVAEEGMLTSVLSATIVFALKPKVFIVVLGLE